MEHQPPVKKSGNKIQGWEAHAWLKITFNALLTTFVFEVRDCSPYKQESLQSYAIIEYIYIPTTHKGSDEGIVTN